MQIDFLVRFSMQGQEISHVEIRNPLTHKVFIRYPPQVIPQSCVTYDFIENILLLSKNQF